MTFFEELEQLTDLVSDGPEIGAGASAKFAAEVNALVAQLATTPCTAADVDDEFTESESDDSATEH